MIDPVSPVHRPAAPERFFAEGCFIAERWNSTADPDVSVARARDEPGVNTRWLRVRGATVGFLFRVGGGRVEVGDGPPEDVGPGDVVLIPPETRQRIANTGDADLLFLAVCTPRFTLAGYEDAEPV